MKNKLFLIVGVIVGLVLMSYMFTFVVRFDQVAVRTSFGSADESSVIKTSGIRFRLPWPFQQVHRYSTHKQLVDTSLGQVLTEDGYSVIVQTYMTWKIEDPLQFYKSLRDEAAAVSKLSELLGATSGQFGQVKFVDLVNADPTRLKLGEVEGKMLGVLKADLARLNYGIEVDHVGIRRFVLPEQVTPKVFDRMKSDRDNRAASVRTRGTSQASAIRSDAQSIRKSILSFANKYAEEIRTRGLTQAAEEYAVFEKDEQFAIFLRSMEALEKILNVNTTFIIDANKVDQHNPLRHLINEPGATPGAPGNSGAATPKPPLR